MELRVRDAIARRARGGGDDASRGLGRASRIARRHARRRHRRWLDRARAVRERRRSLVRQPRRGLRAGHGALPALRPAGERRARVGASVRPQPAADSGAERRDRRRGHRDHARRDRPRARGVRPGAHARPPDPARDRRARARAARGDDARGAPARPRHRARPRACHRRGHPRPARDHGRLRGFRRSRRPSATSCTAPRSPPRSSRSEKRAPRRPAPTPAADASERDES